MLYFDGGEAINIAGRPWRDSHWIQREVAKRLDHDVLITGSGGNAGYGWHTHMRGVANDGVYNRTKRYLDEHKVPQRVAIYHRNLAAAEMGWLNMCAWSVDRPATQPDEWEYFCSKALAYDAPVSLHMHERFFDSNGRAGECLDIIHRYEQARRTAQFSPALLDRLRTLGQEFRLVRDPDAGWTFFRTQYGPTHRIESDQASTLTWTISNPFEAQAVSLRVKARTALRPYGEASSIVLLNPQDELAWRTEGRRTASCSILPSGDGTLDGRAALQLTGRSHSAAPDSLAWCGIEFARRPDLTSHRSLGLWVRGDASQAVLDVQLVDSGLIQARDHTVKLDFTGWRFVRLVAPDFDAAFEYPLFRHKGNLRGFGYNAVRQLRLQLVGMPVNHPVQVGVGPIEALAEATRPLKNPTLEVNGKLLRLPVTLEPDQMLQLLPDGRIDVFDRENRKIETLRISDPLPRFQAGRNRLRFDIQPDGAFATVTPILIGPALQD